MLSDTPCAIIKLLLNLGTYKLNKEKHFLIGVMYIKHMLFSAFDPLIQNAFNMYKCINACIVIVMYYIIV